MESFDLILLLLVPVVVFLVYIGLVTHRQKRRSIISKRPIPREWKEFLLENVQIYSRLPEKMKEKLHGYINIFLDEKYFEGCSGLTVTDEMKVTIAASACLLVLNKDSDFYPKLKTILIYPDTYISGGASRFGNTIINDESPKLGESWQRGVVILSWKSIKGSRNTYGHNVVIHEFAHQLDQENGLADGFPSLAGIDQKEWQRVLNRDYEILREEARQGFADIIDSYGATNPAEFFAVASEAFFEMPGELEEWHAELFKELKAYYCLDPLEWI